MPIAIRGVNFESRGVENAGNSWTTGRSVRSSGDKPTILDGRDRREYEVEIFLTDDSSSGCKTIEERRPTYGLIDFTSSNGAAVPGLHPSSNAKI